jgi:hypothetical protein
VVVVTPLASSYRDDLEGLEILRDEVRQLCARAGTATILLCRDDPWLAALAEQTPRAAGFSKHDVEPNEGGAVLRLGDAEWPVTHDTVGASSRRALAVAARVGRLLGVGDADIASFLART